MACFGGFLAAIPFLPARAPTDERNERLMLLALEVIHDPQGSSELELAGVWMLLLWCLTTRPAVCVSALNAGMLDIAMSELHKSSPAEW